MSQDSALICAGNGLVKSAAKDEVGMIIRQKEEIKRQNEIGAAKEKLVNSLICLCRKNFGLEREDVIKLSKEQLKELCNAVVEKCFGFKNLTLANPLFWAKVVLLPMFGGFSLFAYLANYCSSSCSGLLMFFGTLSGFAGAISLLFSLGLWCMRNEETEFRSLIRKLKKLSPKTLTEGNTEEEFAKELMDGLRIS